MIERASVEELSEYLIKINKQTSNTFKEILNVLSKIPFYKEVIDKQLLLQKEPTILN
jgi:hypothetical protein